MRLPPRTPSEIANLIIQQALRYPFDLSRAATHIGESPEWVNSLAEPALTALVNEVLQWTPEKAAQCAQQGYPVEAIRLAVCAYLRQHRFSALTSMPEQRRIVDAAYQALAPLLVSTRLWLSAASAQPSLQSVGVVPPVSTTVASLTPPLDKPTEEQRLIMACESELFFDKVKGIRNRDFKALLRDYPDVKVALRGLYDRYVEQHVTTLLREDMAYLALQFDAKHRLHGAFTHLKTQVECSLAASRDSRCTPAQHKTILEELQMLHGGINGLRLCMTSPGSALYDHLFHVQAIANDICARTQTRRTLLVCLLPLLVGVLTFALGYLLTLSALVMAEEAYVWGFVLSAPLSVFVMATSDKVMPTLKTAQHSFFRDWMETLITQLGGPKAVNQLSKQRKTQLSLKTHGIDIQRDFGAVRSSATRATP